jgi:sugar (pentulose or hexulose) kinase
MTKTVNFLAFDLGAESGRAVVGRFDGERLSLEEMHRFANGPIRIRHSLHWNVLNLFTEMKHGLAKTVNIEATAIGNILLQMLALDQLHSLSEGRELVCRSFVAETYEPKAGEAWAEAYACFVENALVF